MSETSYGYWPPGGADDVIELLAEKHGINDGTPDIPALLSDANLGKTAIVSSFGADSVALLHYISGIISDYPVLFLDTGKHFPETLEYINLLSDLLDIEVIRVRPEQKLLDDHDPYGALWTSDPDFCCQIRKTFALQDALAEYDTWISGRKRYQSGTRQALPFIERDGEHLKINPFTMWSSNDVKEYITDHDLPLHPLVPQGYPSIGCACCTRKVKPGEDLRAGRWAHVPEKTECGIHLGPDGQFRKRKY